MRNLVQTMAVSGWLMLALGVQAGTGTGRAQVAGATPSKPADAAVAAAPAGWERVQSLPRQAHVHVEADGRGGAESADPKGATCYVIAADAETLTCGRKSGVSKGRRVYRRERVRSVKLTRRGWSTLAGAGVGLGGGLAVGAIAGRAMAPPTGGWLDLSDLARGIILAMGGVVGVTAGAAVGGGTDWLRGPVVYRR